MGSLADAIRRQLEPLRGLRLSVARRAADLRNFQFGRMREVEGGTVGDYALHVQCAWRIERTHAILTGRSDLWEPSDPDEAIDPETWTYDQGENLQDTRLKMLLGAYESKTLSVVNEHNRLVVEAIDADDYGGASLQLSGGYRLVVFPDGTRSEDWRLFQPGTDSPHFVIAGGRIESDSGAA